MLAARPLACSDTIPSMTVFTYEVQYANDHEDMANAVYQTAFVQVQADDEVSANLAAAQMSAVRGGIPTSTRLLHG